MLFNSYTFLVFFTLVLGMYSLPVTWRFKKGMLLSASYIFYAAWNPPFTILLVISTVTDWFFGRWMYASKSTCVRKWLLAGTLSVNLGLLVFFKYSNFILENLVFLLQSVGVNYAPAAPSIILPMGISFYTFQTLSYTIDIYRRNMTPWKSFLDYALYVTFFPQLVAGPIVRASDFLPQCQEPKRLKISQLGWGIHLMIIGLFNKIVIADGILGPVVEKIYDQAIMPSMLTAWVGTLAFAGQIFCDFAGYSTCAIGVAICMGFHLPINFRFPYAAVGFSDFWSRWHISLSTWLRDYLYIPLGGNRKGEMRTVGNLMMTMLLGGLWHGASWNFVIWGGLHGIYLTVERILCRVAGSRVFVVGRFAKVLLGSITFALVCLAWVYFRAKTLDSAFEISLAMFGLSKMTGLQGIDSFDVIIVTFIVLAMLIIHCFMRETTMEKKMADWPWWCRSILIAFLLFAIFTMPGEDRAFIYFQF